MTKVLEICVDLDGGGIDRYLFNYCSRISGVEFDFAVIDSGKKGILEDEIAKLGSTIYRVPRLRSGIMKNYFAMKQIISQGGYDVVHSHLGYWSVFSLFAAKRCGVRKRIAHAHIANEPESKRKSYLRKCLTLATKMLATDLTACGVDAAKWVWGREYEKGKVTIQNNAIDAKVFAYSEVRRVEARRELNLSETSLVVGHVGRLCPQKNQSRLIDIFASLKEMRDDAVLLLIGRGGDSYSEDLQAKIGKLNLGDSVRLLGVRDDVSLLLNAMDVFVFPSEYEGLPFTLIETQCGGLPTVSSDCLTRQVRLTGAVEFMPLSGSNEQWAKAAVLAAQKGRDENAAISIASAGYDINEEAKKLKQFYLK